MECAGIQFEAYSVELVQKQEYRRAVVKLGEIDSPVPAGRTHFSIEVTGPAEGVDGSLADLQAEFERLARAMIRQDVLEEWLSKVRPVQDRSVEAG